MEKKLDLHGIEVTIHYKQPPDFQKLIPAFTKFVCAVENQKKDASL